MFKDIEQIRIDSGLTQKTFAEKYLKTSTRNYLARLSGLRPKWLMNEVILASSLNNGKISVVGPDNEVYNITIKKQ